MDSGSAEISSFRNTASQPSASESAVYLDWQVAPEQLELNHFSTGPPERILPVLSESGLGANSTAKLMWVPV